MNELYWFIITIDNRCGKSSREDMVERISGSEGDTELKIIRSPSRGALNFYIETENKDSAMLFWFKISDKSGTGLNIITNKFK